MDIDGAPEIARLSEVARARARAEAAEWSAMLSHRDAELARIETLDSSMRRLVERAGIGLEIGQAIGLSEAQVHARLAMADRVKTRAPQCWLAFLDGRIDAARVREISSGLDRLEREESWIRLDQSVLGYAETHTIAELRAWLKRFVVRVEADRALERAERVREDRHVQVTHLDDGMAWLSAYLPSHVAAAAFTRLAREARAMGSADGRTKPQRMADLFASWLTHGETTEVKLSADVAVTIEADIFTGLADGYAESTDGEWQVPTSWVLEQIDPDETFWHRLIADPISGDVLSHQYVGRFAPEALAKAIQFRDGICRAPGCRVPAERCDLDHREPWPSGATDGNNMWALCRRHHAMKGHGVLRWVLPHSHAVPAGSAEHRPRPGQASTSEHRLAQSIIENIPD